MDSFTSQRIVGGFGLLAWLVLVGSVAAFGCSGGSGDESADEPWADEPEEEIEPSGTISGTIDDEVYEGTVFVGHYDARFRLFQFLALGDRGMLGFDVASDVMGEGTFDCTSEAADLGGNIDNMGSVSSRETTGPCTIEITEFGGVGEAMRGSFSGTVVSRSRTYTVDVTFDAIRGTSYIGDD